MEAGGPGRRGAPQQRGGRGRGGGPDRGRGRGYAGNAGGIPSPRQGRSPGNYGGPEHGGNHGSYGGYGVGGSPGSYEQPGPSRSPGCSERHGGGKSFGGRGSPEREGSSGRTGPRREEGPRGQHSRGGQQEPQRGGRKGGVQWQGPGTSAELFHTDPDLVKRAQKHWSTHKKMELRTNYFGIARPRGIVYHYDVEIGLIRKPSSATEPRGLSTRVKRLVIEALQKTAKFRPYSLAFDGEKNIYTSRELPSNECECVVQIDKGGPDFSVTLKLASSVDMDKLKTPFNQDVHQKHIQALDIIIRHAARPGHEVVGHCFFKNPQAEPLELATFAELWSGYYTSFRPCENSLMLNIDFSAMPFYNSRSLLDFATMCREGDKITLWDTRLLTEALEGLQVYTTHLGYKRFYRVVKVSENNAANQKLKAQESATNGQESATNGQESATNDQEMEKKGKERAKKSPEKGKGEEMSVVEYFAKKYRIEIKQRLPCILCKGKEEPYLPLDLCHVPAQPCKRKLDKDMTERMLAALGKLSPEQRFAFIQKFADDFFSRAQHCLRGFNLEFFQNMVEVKAHILSPPSIHFQVGKKVPYRGAWYVPKGDLFSETKGQFFFGVLAVNCEIPSNELLEAADQLKDYGSALGLQLKHNKNIEHVHTNDLEASKHLAKAFKDLEDKMPDGKKFVLVVLGNSTLYAAVKTVAEKVAGIITQCVQEGKLSTVKPEVLWPNICLKLNAKLGGCNNTVSSDDKNVNAIFINAIFIGIDVNHPAPGDNHKPSIAACVASIDKNSFRYRAQVSVQMNPDGAVARKEVVTDLKAMVSNHLKFYYGKHGRLPDRIIVYRDGVGEGQFKEVQAKEVDAIKKACRSIRPNYEPPVTFIIVQKRHHTRFLPILDKKPINVNVPPGTTVENGITQPGHLNFFLCSHQGPIGTSRPAHYHVLCKESKHTLQQLQQLTYNLCHLVARCTRSMSIPSPVYYAHLAAFRAKNHIKGFLRINPNGQYTDAVTVHRNIANEMYFV